ncbi:MAG: cytochrome c oxidase subunit II [Chloroflexi bacterium]|nr:cytochrome c oxidase subunit II [Chloroflexota bacterium]
MNRHTFIVAILWVVLTILGEALVAISDLSPLAAAKEAAIVDGAFRVLMVLAVPVVAFVIATLAYSIIRFRIRGEPSQDGPPIRSHGRLIAVWFAVTSGLTVLMVIYPGIIGMNELADLSHEEPDMVVKVEGMRFAWRFTYPEQNVSTFKELVLPVDKHVRFDVTSRDVLHSFWVPAFRMKIDAVPGMVTTVHATPDKTGTFGDDTQLRLQCTELCGLGHSIMTVPVRVVEQSEFEAWVAQQTQTARR